MILVKWVLFKLHNTFSLQKNGKRERSKRKGKKTIFSLSIWTNMANKALFECGIWSKTLHALGFIDEDESTSEPNHFGTHKYLKDFFWNKALIFIRYIGKKRK